MEALPALARLCAEATADTVTLEWEPLPVPFAVDYRVCMQHGDGPFVQLFMGRETRFVARGLAPFTTYHFKVGSRTPLGTRTGCEALLTCTTRQLPPTRPPTEPSTSVFEVHPENNLQLRRLGNRAGCLGRLNDLGGRRFEVRYCPVALETAGRPGRHHQGATFLQLHPFCAPAPRHPALVS